MVNTMGCNERSDPDMRTANFCDVYREGVYLCASNVTPNGCSLLGICFSVFVVLLPNVFHTNDMFAKLWPLSKKTAEKNTKNVRLAITHYKQKPSGSDLWPVNRCVPI